jgi:hypothetical protein
MAIPLARLTYVAFFFLFSKYIGDTRVINWINRVNLVLFESTSAFFRCTYALGFRCYIRLTGVLLVNDNSDLAYPTYSL